jgi:hypothetical protein
MHSPRMEFTGEERSKLLPASMSTLSRDPDRPIATKDAEEGKTVKKKKSIKIKGKKKETKGGKPMLQRRVSASSGIQVSKSKYVVQPLVICFYISSILFLPKRKKYILLVVQKA